MKIIQFLNEKSQCCVGIVQGKRIQHLKGISSAYELFNKIINEGVDITEAISQFSTDHFEDYDSIIAENRLLLPFQHPDPYHTWITGTGLTHLGSAESRSAMHEKLGSTAKGELTDSMKMFQIGLENGKMQAGIPGAQPEWFYKGNGLIAIPPGHSLPAPTFALDAGEEPEIVGIYLNGLDGRPNRVGFALANEFSDHKMEKINYLYLSHSKLRYCSYGPELLVGELPSHISGQSRIYRENKILWEKEFLTGEANMSHNIANLEHHHFKYDLFRQPGDVHIHFLGTSVLSFSDQVETKEGDVFEIEADAFEKPLRNSLTFENVNRQNDTF